ncbi:MAG TPA: 3-hydroxyacyl-CoA dehydrogenase NAD-binding domain-containing protein [Alphaproteobacteria bacterium]|nr:3-hydroxyacyl-CoA dehydrogenase NAD-binding domain-containing protein [Alphaproteobacteria bacterium]
MEIRKAAVIGAGLMGGGIAAQIANAGIPVVLLDRAAEGDNRRAIVEGALDRLLKSEPAAFMRKANARLVTLGTVEDDLGLIADADWIVEAVLEDRAIKRALYEKLEAIRKPRSIVSSNTSTIPLAELVAAMPEAFRRDFLITHFFNPPRYMRLLEIVAGPETRPEAVEVMAGFADQRLGKGVVRAKDRPGFVANRIGVYWMQASVVETLDLGLTVEEADAVMGRPLGFPKTGVFGLMDLVGLDLQPHVDRSMAAALPKDDPYHAIRRDFPLMSRLIAEGYTGRKGKGGFYRLDRSGGGRLKQAIDLATGAYRPAEKPRLESIEAAKTGGLRALVSHPDKGGRYAWRVLSGTLSYAASLVPEIADAIDDVDRAMRLGYNWARGPFELIDALGAAWFAERLRAEGRPVPPFLARAAERGGFYRIEKGVLHELAPDGGYVALARAPGVLLLADVKRAGKPVKRNGSAALWDIGEGVFCLEFTSKMNAIDQDTLAMLKASLDHVKAAGGKGLVIHNEGEQFSVGANIGLALFAANIALWPAIEDMVRQGQQVLKAVKYAPFPIVGAPSGMALGGGCEILLHSSAVVAHAETYMGLVEVGVGVIPGWGGCKEMLRRLAERPGAPKGPMPAVMQAFETIGTAKVSRSAAEAKEIGYLRPSDRIVMNRERLLAEAKTHLLELAQGYQPPKPAEYRLPGPTAARALELAVEGFVQAGKATPHDRTVSLALAQVLSGGKTDVTRIASEDDILALERDAFGKLVRTSATLARIEHMLETGKPLRN